MQLESEAIPNSDANEHSSDGEQRLEIGLSRRSVLLFYTSHFLFTWNDRVWEFASVILLIAAYPLTLLPSSVFGLTTTASAILLGPTVGRWFDATVRINGVRSAILSQRIGVGAGCICLWAMISRGLSSHPKEVLFVLVIFLGCVARLAFVGKTAAIERDWVRTSSGELSNARSS